MPKNKIHDMKKVQRSAGSTASAPKPVDLLLLVLIAAGVILIIIGAVSLYMKTRNPKIYVTVSEAPGTAGNQTAAGNPSLVPGPVPIPLAAALRQGFLRPIF